MNHHPDIEIRLTKVPLKLTTHDEGGITKKVSPVPGDAMRCRREF
jgi:pterin-4a-carbinolamine dehydratase